MNCWLIFHRAVRHGVRRGIRHLSRHKAAVVVSIVCAGTVPAVVIIPPVMMNLVTPASSFEPVNVPEPPMLPILLPALAAVVGLHRARL